MALYAAEVEVQVDDYPMGRFAVAAVKAASEEEARKAVIKDHRDAFAKAYPDRRSLSVEIVSIERYG